jgi:hypothetical protein
MNPVEHLFDKDTAKPDFENVGSCSHPCYDHLRITHVCQPPICILYSWLITISLPLLKWRRSAGYADQGIAYSTTCSAWSVHVCSIESFAMPLCLRLCELSSFRGQFSAHCIVDICWRVKHKRAAVIHITHADSLQARLS